MNKPIVPGSGHGRPRGVPIPNESPVPITGRVQIPPVATQLPRKPGPETAAPKPQNYMGMGYSGLAGADGAVIEFLNPLEFKEGKSLAVQLIQDTQVPIVRAYEADPNANVRARVVYRSGRSGDVSFDCDWSGGFVVHAERLEIYRVNYRPDPVHPYFDSPIKIVATVAVDGARSPFALTYTEPPRAIAIDDPVLLDVPPLARRVSLLLTHEVGDAPLGQLFAAFMSKLDNPLGWVDAMSARDALFGNGVPIPFGASKLALSNRSTDADIKMGCIFHLGI